MQTSISRWQSSLQTHVNNKIWNNIYCICRQTLFQPSLAWRQTKWYKIWISVNHIISHTLYSTASVLSHTNNITPFSIQNPLSTASNLILRDCSPRQNYKFQQTLCRYRVAFTWQNEMIPDIVWYDSFQIIQYLH